MRLSTLMLLLAVALPAAAQTRPDARGTAARHPELLGPEPTETAARGTAGGGVFTDISTSPTGPSVDGIVNAVLPGPNGSFVVGGHFLQAGGQPAANVARWTGASWQPLGSGLSTPDVYNSTVRALVTSPDGTLYAGGTFTTSGGVSVSGVARWDGSAWRSLSGASPDTLARYVNSLAVGPDGRLYAGGSFADAPGHYVSGVARWDGTAWEVLGGRTPLTRTPVALVVATDGAVYAGGRTLLTGLAAVARWDGTDWTSIGATTGTEAVSSLAIEPGGALVAGGSFTSISGVAARSVARWDGASWSPLGSGIEGGAYALAAGLDGMLYAGGSFTTAGDQPARNVARWDGAAWTPLGRGTDGNVSDLDIDADGKVVVGGSFGLAGGAAANYVARWDGTSWNGFGSETFYVNAVAPGPDGRLYAAGLSTVAGRAVDGVARWDGTAWSAIGEGPGGPGSALTAGADGRIVAARYSGYVRVWNGTSWTTLSGDDQSIPLGGIYSVAIGSDGAVYAGGGHYQRGIVRWNGTAWTDVGAGLQGLVWCMTVGPDGRLYVGGEFIRRPGDATEASVARWDGTAWEVIGATERGSEVPVYALAFAPNGDLYAGGRFTTMNGVPTRSLARWDGAAWSAVGASAGVPSTVWALAFAADGRLYVGGIPRSATSYPGFSRWDGTSWTALGPLTGFGHVYGLGIDRTGDVIVGGVFRGAGSVVSPNVVRYTPGAVASEPAAGADRLSLAVAPNPARGAATVTLSHPAGAVTVEVLDALGRRVALIADGDAAAGTRTLALPLGQLAPGAYVVRMTAGRETVTRPLVVVR